MASRPRRAGRSTLGRLASTGIALLVLAAACGREDQVPGASTTSAASPTSRMPSTSEVVAPDTDLVLAGRRAVGLATRGCGAADPAQGSGIALDGDRVLTAAHLVASGGEVTIVSVASPAEGTEPLPAEVVAYDPRRDLAIVGPSEPLTEVPPAPAFGDLAIEQSGTIVGGSRSGDVEAVVLDVTIIEIDDVRLPTRSTRRGFLVDGATGPGDSGAGLYDTEGRLAGLLFAVSTENRQRSWVTAASEIEAFLADDSTLGTFGCDPDRSRITRLG